MARGDLRGASQNKSTVPFTARFTPRGNLHSQEEGIHRSAKCGVSQWPPLSAVCDALELSALRLTQDMTTAVGITVASPPPPHPPPPSPPSM